MDTYKFIRARDHARGAAHFKCIHSWFEAQAARTPEAIAVRCDSQQLTYAELNARANILAHELIRSGVGPETLVGLHLERSLDIVVGILGILKSGAAYLPVDPDNPQSRTQFVLEDAHPRVIVTATRLRERLPQITADIICVDRLDRRNPEDLENPAHSVGPENLAYVIYTSGSTGQPKGTLVTHRNVLRLFQTCESLFEFRADDVWSVFHSFAFDFSVWELWGALLHGATAVLVSRTLARTPQAFRELLFKERVTVLSQTPSAFYPLIQADAAAAPLSPLALRYVIFGGEALEFRRLEPWFERHGEWPRLINMYGITETTVHATYHVISKDELGSASIIGVPLPDLRIHILDENRSPVAQGVMGEIHVGGPGVARGYLNRPELTEARFIPDPFSQERSARLYKSGDRARARPDGTLEFGGRADNQVKLRGYRIELGEIESALSGCPQVSQAIVALQDGPADEKELVAYLIAGNGAAPSPTRLRAELSARLPAYMVPSAFVLLESWPLTVNGKIDRLALPRPRREHRVELAATAPRSVTEAQVAAAWCEALATDQVGIYDDYFELGAHSLMAARVCARLCETFDVPLSVSDLFAARNVAALAQMIDARSDRRGIRARPRLQAAERDRGLPTSFAQDAALFFHELAPGNLAYNNQVTVRLRGELDIPVLERALSEIVRRHEVLRTTFERDGAQWQQIIHPAWPVRLPILEEAPGRLASLFKHHFDPAHLPLVQWTLVRVGPLDHILVHVEHHLIHDGWSFGVFVQELIALYTGYREGTASVLPELPLQFADFAAWQRNVLTGDTLTELLSYWQGKLTGPLPILDLPADRPRPKIQGFEGDEVQGEIPPRLAVALRAFARSTGSSLFIVTLAAFLALLRRYSGQDDIIVGAGYANRGSRELETLIGMIVNMLPLRVDLSGDPTFVELCARVQTVARDALAHQEVPFELIVRHLDLPRDPSRNPLCQVAFSFHDSLVPKLELPGLTADVAYPHNGSAKFDMNIIVIPWAEQQGDAPQGQRDERITIKWDCNTHLFDVETVERMLEQYVRMLEAAVTDPETRISDLAILDDAGRRQLAEWNRTARAYPGELSIATLFEQQVERTPHAIAVTFADRALRYDEVNERANRVAHYLRRHGVGPEEKVGICVRRSTDMVIGILGILKAGGAYVPLDPDYPQSRRDFMLRDTNARVLLTQSNLRSLLSSFDGTVVTLDADWVEIEREPSDNPPSNTSGGNLAYVMYTSGSTGTPKGVCVEHRSVIRLVRDTNYVALGPDETILQFAPISFDASTFELWGSLLNGGRLVVPAPGAPSLQELAGAIREHKITTLWLTAALFHQMVELELEALKGVRQLLAGGEALSVTHVQQMLAALAPGHTLVNGYGPTENTTFTCCHVMTPDSPIGRSVPVGKPIANTQTYILDERRRPVPIGVPGELYIGGDGLAREYLNQPELTAERFISLNGRRLYRSGDKARYFADGTIEFIGRTDDQVKLRGYRIEPGEIESVLCRHPSVHGCAVVLRTVSSGDKRLVAYVVAKERVPAFFDGLRQFLKTSVPSYMIPSDFVAIDELPLTPNGKVDRNCLPAPEERSAEVRGASAPPSTPTEAVLMPIWSRHLGHANFGVHDDFFDLGGHSLAAAAILADITANCGVSPPLALFFQNRTIATLARAIADGSTHDGVSHLIPVQPAGTRPPIFAVFGVGGGYAAYATVADRLGHDQPFYSLEMPGLEGGGTLLERIEDIAERFCGEIREVRAGEPCVLIGACAGALVVFEMARKLAAQARLVEVVIMLDPPPTGAKRSRRLSTQRLWRQLLVPRFLLARAWMHLRTAAKLRGAKRRAFMREKLSVIREIFAQRDLFRASRHELHVSRVLEAASAALSRHVPRPYGGRVALLLGDRYASDGERNPSSDWKALCSGPLQIKRVPGKDTGQMLKPPNADVLVVRLKEILGAVAAERAAD